MASSEEKLNILKMIQESKISAEEGVKLLESLEKGESNPSGKSTGMGSKTGIPRWMRVIITDLNTNREKINIRLPANVVDAGYKMGARYVPDLSGINSEQILRAVQMGEIGKVIDVCDQQSCERIVILLE
jgi:hypothetical protein